MSTATRRLRSASVTLGVTALVAAGLTGCSPQVDNQGICVDPVTQKRVDDKYCEDTYHGTGANPYAWYYLSRGARIPPIGGGYASSKGTFDGSTLGGRTTRGGAPAGGGSAGGGSDTGGSHVSRGGFGGTSHAGS